MTKMNSREIYKSETGKEPIFYNGINTECTNNYINWLENSINICEPSILKWMKKMFNHAEKNQWFETYWTIDIHGTVSKPDFRKDEKKITYYPYAKETLQLMSNRKDIIMILWTSSYPDELEIYKKNFKEDNINFNYECENPDVQSSKGSFGYYEKKHYFNVLFDDKSGFNPEQDWKFIYDYFSNTKYRPDSNWIMKYDEKYHKNK